MSEESNKHQEMFQRLFSELEALPANDSPAHLAYAARVEKTIAENSSAPAKLIGLVHFLAAQAIASAEVYSDAIEAQRLLGHLGAAAQNPELSADDGLADLVRQRRAAAFVRLREVLSPELLPAAIAAFEDVLEHPGSSTTGNIGVFAYNAGLYQMRLAGSEGGDRTREERFFRAARGAYKEAGQERRAADAAGYLSRIALERLKSANTAVSDLNDIFEDAWRWINEAIAPVPITSEPLEWARRNELAAEILWKRPGAAENLVADDVLGYLDRALNVYQQLGDAASAAQSAVHCADATSYLRADLDPTLVQRFLFYLKVATAASFPDAGQEAAKCFLLANSCARAQLSGARSSQEIVGQMRSLAERACQLAPGNDMLCAEAFFLIGNSWLNTAGEASDILPRASAAFEQARHRAQATGQAVQETKALRLLGATLGRRFLECNESDLLPELLETLQSAAERSTGEEQAAAYVNLTSAIVEALQRGIDVPLERAKAAVSKATEMAASLTPAHWEYLQTLADTVHEFVWGLRDAAVVASKLLGVDGEQAAPNTARPETIYFKQYATEKRTGDNGPRAIHTLLLFLQDDGHSDGRMSFSYGADSVSASFELDCPECRKRIRWTLPLIARLEEDSLARERLGQYKSGLLRCSACNAPSQIQFSVLVRVAASDRIVIIQPDALWQKSRYTTLSQSLLLYVIYQGMSGKIPENPYALRWIGVETFQDVSPGEFLAAGRVYAASRFIRAILLRDEPEIRSLLGNASPLIENPQPLSQEDIAAAFEYLDPSLKRAVAEVEPAQFTNLNGLLKLARENGVDFAIEGLREWWGQRAAAAQEFQAALSIASDEAQRRQFLETFLAETPDYSADREAEMYRILQLGTELELRTKEEEGMPQSDPERYADLLRMVEVGRALAKSMIDDDRKNNTSRQAKALLEDKLRADKPFLLLLRAFSVDVKSGLATGAWDRAAGTVSDPRVRWQMSAYDNPSRSVLEKIAAALVSHAGVIMVANASDVMPPHTPAKLFVTNLEWRKLAFSLIAEAAAIILLLPPENLSGGVQDEIDAIHALARESQTAIVLGKASELDLLETSTGRKTDSTDPEALLHKVQALGLPHIFQHDIFLERAWEIVEGLTQSDSSQAQQ